jgi:hypothetical protein
MPKERQSWGGGAVSDTVSLTTGGAANMMYGAKAEVMLFGGSSDNGIAVRSATSPRRGTPGRFGLTPRTGKNPITARPMTAGPPEDAIRAAEINAPSPLKMRGGGAGGMTPDGDLVVDIANVAGMSYPGRRQQFASPAQWGGAGGRRYARDPYTGATARTNSDGGVAGCLFGHSQERARSADGVRSAYGTIHPKDDITALYSHHNREEFGVMHGSHKRKIDIQYSQPPQHISASARYYEYKQHGRASSADPPPAPFATDANNDAPDTIFQKRKVPPPTGRRLRTDEDAFLLKTSRTPPVGAKALQCTDEEGFAVLLSTDPGRNRAPLSGGRMVRNDVGKGQSDFVQRTAVSRVQKEAALMEDRQRRCASAYLAEVDRMDKRATCDFNFISKNRAHNPGSAGPYPTPWALNLSAPHAASVGKPVPRWKR